ncbi:MAG TPA: DUF2062 domain-containing protein [Candidatus Bathyarchaeia archaeon]|nr:DUF2062 domain-containing protein [Candidatus Bathyarchaeia archaeon]
MKRRIRDYIKQFFLIDDTPHKVAGGAALGAFLGIIPGEGVLSTLFLAYIFRLNRLASLAGVLAFNMWTTFVALPIAAAIGGLIFRISPKTLSNDFHESLGLGWQYIFSWDTFREAALPLLVGYAVLGGIVAAAVYFGLLYLLIKRKKLREKKHVLRDGTKL